MNPNLNHPAKKFLNRLKQSRVVSKTAAWWQSDEGVVARQALSVWLRRLTEGQPPVEVELVETQRVVEEANKEGQVVSTLRAWIAKNGQDLEGHPSYKALSEEEKGREVLLGRYTLEVLRLPITTVKTVLGKVPKEFANTWINSNRAVWVFPAQLAAYPVLLQWCKDNAHRIEGHPRYQEEKGLEPLGDYEPETVALSKNGFEQILGFVPESIKQRDLILGGDGNRRRLYEYVLTEEPPF